LAVANMIPEIMKATAQKIVVTLFIV